MSRPTLPDPSRRQFLASTCQLAIAAVATSTLLSRTQSIMAQPSHHGKRPNILFIIGDDWSFPHTGFYGDTVALTPNLNQIAQQGIKFNHAYVPAPSCSPCRASILSGMYPHALGTGMNLSGPLPPEIPLYPKPMTEAGYHVGYMGKGYGPAWLDKDKDNKPGTKYPDFDAFLKSKPKDKPFLFWIGPKEPHRKYNRAVTHKYGPKPDEIQVPPYLPDAQPVREDLADYFAEIRKLDEMVGDWMKQLEAAGEADNTMVIITGDNGLPFPRAKATMYDPGCRVPLLIRWPGHIKPASQTDAMVNLVDLTPTFFTLAGIEHLPQFQGRCLVPLLSHGDTRGREFAFTERDIHVPHKDGKGYPMRAIRNSEYLYIRNLEPDRWPSGPADQISGQFPSGFVDTDDGPAKQFIVAQMKENPDYYFGRISFAKRPAEELYHTASDPDQLKNLADDPQYASVKNDMFARLVQWMHQTSDPHAAMFNQ